MQPTRQTSIDSIFKYAVENPLETEMDYPQAARVGACHYVKSKGVGNVSKLIDVRPMDAGQLKFALTKGPVAVYIEADKMAFQAYQGGIIAGGCGQSVDDVVLAVGYGVENGNDFFIIKNSWGSQWGASGYAKISATQENVCGILTMPSYPVV